MAKKETEFKYSVNSDYDEVVDERGNTSIMLRMVSWMERQERLELRKWVMDVNGNERPYGGFAFLTEDGPSNLTKILVKKGYGQTEELLGELKEREDFEDSLIKVIGKKAVTEAKNTETKDYYDPREVLL